MCVCLRVCGCAEREYTLDNVTLAYFYPLAVTQCKIEDIPVESALYRLHKYVSNVIRSQPSVSPHRLTQQPGGARRGLSRGVWMH